MFNPGYPMDSFVIIDNNVIVSICDFCFNAYKSKNFSEVIQDACNDMEEIFNAIKRFSMNQQIYTTPCVMDEFKPENGSLSKHSGFKQLHCEALKRFILSQIECLEVNLGRIQRLRRMNQSPGRLGENLSRLSDQDLSLAILALGIAHKFNNLVYVLIDDEDLRYFISWMRSKSEIKEICDHPDKIEALHSLTYLDTVHRNCGISSQKMNEIFGFQTVKQLGRQMLNGTTKGEMISSTYDSLYQAMIKSSRIKLMMKEAMQ